MSEAGESGWLVFCKYFGGAASAGSALLALVFALWPGLKPAESPNELGAQIHDVTTERNVTLAEYLKRSGIASEAYSQEQLQSRGSIVYFTVDTRGFKGRPLPSRFAVYDGATGRLLDGTNRLRGPTFTPEAASDRASSDVWVPDPGASGDYFVRLELWDDKGVRLVYKDSEAIVR